MTIINNLKKILASTGLAVVLACSSVVSAADYTMFAKSATDDSAKIKEVDTSAGRNNQSLISLEEAQKPEIADPLADADYQIKELDKLTPIVENLVSAIAAHNIMNSLRGYRDSLKTYHDMIRLHDKSVEVLMQSEQCTIDYLGRYFNDPVKIWSGMDLRSHPQDHELRKGLSAWAINAFEVAKSSQLSPISADDVNSIGLISIDDNLTKEKTDNEVIAENGKNKVDNANITEDKRKEVDDLIASRDGVFFKEPSKQEEYEKDSRKANLLSKDIGAEASLMLAEDPEKWGTMKKKFPVWNDQKSFYNQYLDGKYNNIEQFILDAEITAETKARISAALLEEQRKLMSQAEYDINVAALAAIQKTNAQYDGDYEALLKKHHVDFANAENAAESAINSINIKHENAVATINQKLKNLHIERDDYAKAINDINVSIQALNNTINDYNQEITMQESELSREGVTDLDRERFNKQKAELQKEIDEANATITEQNTKKVELEQKYNELSDKITQELNDIGQLDNQSVIDIEQTKDKKAEALASLSNGFNEDHQKLIKARDDKINKINLASVAAKAALQTNSSITVQDIINTTKLIIGIAKTDAIANIVKTRNMFDTIGDDLYRGNKHDIVLGYHQALVKSLKGEDASYENLKLAGVTGKVRSITTNLTGIVSGEDLDNSLSEMFINLQAQYIKDTNIILKVKLFDNLLKKADDSTDTQYFVGSTPKLEDYRAPMVMPDYNLPPFREYVRFDTVDMENIVKDSAIVEVGHTEEIKFGGKVIGTRFVADGKRSLVDKNKFLSYGSRMPEIWKMMLKDKAFVESDFYLDGSLAPVSKNISSNVLRLGGETLGLYRGGIYPCIMRNIKTQGANDSCDIENSVSKGTGVVDVIVSEKGDEYKVGLGFVSGDKRAALLQQNLPTCMQTSASCKTKMGLVGGKISKSNTPYLGFNNGDVEDLDTASGSNQDAEFSELGTILSISGGKVDGKLVNGVLTLSPDMQSIWNYYIRVVEANKKQQDVSMKGADKLKDDIFSRAPMIDNQIGDFLNKAESEQVYKNALEELKVAIETMQKDLLDTLKSVGFVPTPEFDISKEEDYNLAKNKVNSVKMGHVKIAKEGVESIKEYDSELLIDSKNAYRKIVEALITDKNAVTPMSTNVYDSYSLDEEVKTGETNQKVDAAYQTNADKSIEEQLKSFESAYCSAY